MLLPLDAAIACAPLLLFLLAAILICCSRSKGEEAEALSLGAEASPPHLRGGAVRSALGLSLRDGAVWALLRPAALLSASGAFSGRRALALRTRADAALAGEDPRLAPFLLPEPPPDPAHCLASPPREPPSPTAGRLFVAPRCGGGIGNQLGCLGAAVAFAFEFGRCVVIPEVFHHHSSTAEAPYNATIFRHFSEHAALLPYVDGEAAAARQVAQPGGAYVFTPFAQQQPPLTDWLAVANSMFFSYNYTAPVREALAAYLRPPPAVAAALLRKYPGLARGVVVHFRRNDYINITIPGFAPFSFPIPGRFYYAQAGDQLVAALPPAQRAGLVFFVFTQDWEWARAQEFVARFPGRVVFVDGEDEVASWYMMLMAGEGLVCANSTFCWWAAWLGRVGRTVFLPSHFTPWDDPTGRGGIFYPGATVVHSDLMLGDPEGARRRRAEGAAGAAQWDDGRL